MNIIISLVLSLLLITSLLAQPISGSTEYHDELTDCYYNNKTFYNETLTKDRFDELHKLNGLEFEKDKYDKGEEMNILINIVEVERRIKKIKENKK